MTNYRLGENIYKLASDKRIILVIYKEHSKFNIKKFN